MLLMTAHCAAVCVCVCVCVYPLHLLRLGFSVAATLSPDKSRRGAALLC